MVLRKPKLEWLKPNRMRRHIAIVTKLEWKMLGSQAGAKEWIARQIRTARPPAQVRDYCVRSAVEWLSAKRLHTSMFENASLCDLFDFTRLKFEVNDLYSVLTLPFGLPVGMEEAYINKG